MPNFQENVDNDEMSMHLHYLIRIDAPKETIQLLIELGADIHGKDQHGNTPLDCAISAGKPEIIRLLIDSGIDIHGKDQHSLHYWINVNASKETIQLLIELGADIHGKDQHGNTPLDCAISAGKPEIIRSLVNSGADINRKNKNGNTLLYSAIIVDAREEIIQLLIELGADINAKDQYGTTPLELVISKHKGNALKLFIANNPQLTSQHINASLWKAIKESNSEEHIHWLLTMGADANFKDEQGKTCLHIAAEECRRWKYIEPLLQAGAKVYIRNNEDQTPLNQLITARANAFQEDPQKYPL